MASSDSPPIVSPTGIIHVLGYTPTEGERGVPITVRIHFHPDLADAMFVRLVVGNKAVPTRVRQLPAVTYGRWQLYAAAPPFDRAQFPSTKVLISVQALNEDNAILDSVTFGEFSYWATGISFSFPSSYTRLTLPHFRLAPFSFPKSPQQRKTRLHRRMKAQSLMRTKQHPSNVPSQDELYAQTPILEMVTPLSSICLGWTPAEAAVGRRLVRFSKIQDGRRLIDEFCESDSVISCIYREESDSCYVTSVDVIYLLERLTNGEFPVEEKNRIRRNLEGLRPTTVSKHKPGFGDFFQRIMEFPDPKPRNIEKDLKVFEWNLLGQALEKILSKYVFHLHLECFRPARGRRVPESTPTVSADSPELYAVQLSYPAPEEASTSRFLDQKACISNTSPTQKSSPCPLRAAPTPTPHGRRVLLARRQRHHHLVLVDVLLLRFPLFSGGGGGGDTATSENDGGHQGGDNHPWGPAFKATDMALVENFNIMTSYEVAEPGGSGGSAGGVHHGFGDGPGLDFNIYDGYAFQGIADDQLASLADQYI
ncbi:hypothetical protein BDZ97DRAFT_1900817 [Flammula alnicola]|nr:hypothetical protein BDZ97DRAFT_1900817 [Flammula alnicola]